MTSPNIRIDIEYDGEPFCGWQRQDPHPTVQGILEKKISEVVGKPVTLYGAGRTDSGVHALNQVANFYPGATSIPHDRWPFVLNTKLPKEIRLTRSCEAPPTFHAQKSARGKIYAYHVLNRGYASALDRRAYFCPFPLDWNAIHGVLPFFEGEHDFRAFNTGPLQTKTSIRKVKRFQLFELGNGLYRFEVEGNGFLKQMVRNMIGTVLEVGQHLCSPDEIPRVFESRDRKCAGRAVPARGLFLVKVLYEVS